MLPEPLIEETPLLYRKGKRRAMTGLEIAEEKEKDALRQRRRDERAAVASAAADTQLEEREREKREEEELRAAVWVADTQLQLQLSQLSYQEATNEDQHSADENQRALSSSSSHTSEVAADSEKQAGLGSQAQPVEISSSSDDDEPRRSGRVKRSTRAVESQNWQIEHGIIPAPGAKAKARALNAKKKRNTETSQLDTEFKLIE